MFKVSFEWLNKYTHKYWQIWTAVIFVIFVIKHEQNSVLSILNNVSSITVYSEEKTFDVKHRFLLCLPLYKSYFIEHLFCC